MDKSQGYDFLLCFGQAGLKGCSFSLVCMLGICTPLFFFEYKTL